MNIWFSWQRDKFFSKSPFNTIFINFAIFIRFSIIITIIIIIFIIIMIIVIIIVIIKILNYFIHLFFY